ADVELHTRVLESLEPAFVGGQLRRVGAVGRDQRSDGEKEQPDADTDQDEKQDRKVLFQHDGIDHPRQNATATKPSPQRTATALSARAPVVLVPTGRLELPRLTPLPPQDSVSTNFTTSACPHAARSVRIRADQELLVLADR